MWHSKRILELFTFLFLIFNIIFLPGCNKNDNPVNPSQHINISGKVTDYWGNGVSNLKVEINSTTNLTSSDGSFIFSDIIIPYDITVYTYFGTSETFCNLSTANPIISTNLNSNQFFNNNTNITVILPQFNSNQDATVLYYDNSGIYQSDAHLYNSNYATINHRWNGNSSTSGMVAVWIYISNN